MTLNVLSSTLEGFWRARDDLALGASTWRDSTWTSDDSARDVEEAKRLHKEAMKQSAVDPKTGRIDVTILTTGYSAEDRRHRFEEFEATTLKKLIREKGELNAWSLW